MQITRVFKHTHLTPHPFSRSLSLPLSVCLSLSSLSHSLTLITLSLSLSHTRARTHTPCSHASISRPRCFISSIHTSVYVSVCLSTPSLLSGQDAASVLRYLLDTHQTESLTHSLSSLSRSLFLSLSLSFSHSLPPPPPPSLSPFHLPGQDAAPVSPRYTPD